MSHRSLPIFATVVATIAELVASQPAAATEPAPAATEVQALDRASIEKLIGGIVVELREGYVYPDKGLLAADALQRALRENAYADIHDPAEFAARLTEQLRALTGDSHVRVISGSPFANQPPPSGPEDAGFDVKTLDGNIGYIHLSRFVAPEGFNSAADEAMRKVSDTDALIVDMRDNGGGHPGSVAYLASFFIDPKDHVHINDLIWRNRGTSTFKTESFWSTATPVCYVGKPVYVLIGPKTYSAGEEFAYDLQVLKRAVLVGEKTRGGANPGGLTELGMDLFVVVPPGRAQNPTTSSNWGGVGVHPDVSATIETAEAVAASLARNKVTELSAK